MKAHIFYWASGYHLATKIDYAHNQEIPVEDVFKIAQEIFDKGLNVMIYRHKENDNITLFVDHMRFQQR